MRRFWTRLSRPVRIGLVLGLIGAILTVVGVFKGGFAPLTVRSVLLGILIGGGAWGVVSWAIAAAASDAMEGDSLEEEDPRTDGDSENRR